MAGSMEARDRATKWSEGRLHAANLKFLNKEMWDLHLPPRMKTRRYPRIRLKIKKSNISSNIMVQNVCRGPPASGLIRAAKSLLHLTALAVSLLSLVLLFSLPALTQSLSTLPHATTLALSPPKANSQTPLLTRQEAFAALQTAKSSRASSDTVKWATTATEINPFVQPNDSTMLYYGSGDVDSNNVRDWNDYYLILEGAQNEQADIDGDGTPGTPQDAELFAKWLSGDTLLPQIDWANPDVSRRERVRWVKKMFAIDKTDTISYVSDYWECENYAEQVFLNFHGWEGVGVDSLHVWDFFYNEWRDEDTYIHPKYNTTMNGRFNLPVYMVSSKLGNGGGGHGMNVILVGDSALKYEDWCIIEPQTDDIDIKPGKFSYPITIPYGSRLNFCKVLYFPKHPPYRARAPPFMCWTADESGAWYWFLDDDLVLAREDSSSSNTDIAARPSETGGLESCLLAQNYPNPFNSITHIEYVVPKKENVLLQVYDLRGRLVETLVDRTQKPGTYKVDFNASSYSSGIYIYTIRVGDKTQTRKMVLVK